MLTQKTTQFEGKAIGAFGSSNAWNHRVFESQTRNPHIVAVRGPSGCLLVTSVILLMNIDVYPQMHYFKVPALCLQMQIATSMLTKGLEVISTHAINRFVAFVFREVPNVLMLVWLKIIDPHEWMMGKQIKSWQNLW